MLAGSPAIDRIPPDACHPTSNGITITTDQRGLKRPQGAKCDIGATNTSLHFTTAIAKAKEACENSGHSITDHFVEANKMVKLGSGSQRKTEDYHLTRYACYLIIQNADPSKPIVALGQTYFAVQTRRQEIADELALANLPEDQKRLIFRSLMSTYNIRLAETAQHAGVIEPHDFATFQDHGYMGLYDGRRENDIHAYKGLQPKEKILDFMGSEELAANMFRATQADAKLKRDQVKSKGQANITHFDSA